MSPFVLLIFFGQVVIAFGALLTPARSLAVIPAPLRIFLGLIVLVFGGFFVFGFLATFEPLDPATQWGFRIFYALATLGALAGAIRLFLPRRPSASL